MPIPSVASILIISSLYELIISHYERCVDRGSVILEIILGVIIILYIFFFCVPGFFLIWEWDNSWPGCYMIICGFVGFPGAVLALLMKIPGIIADRNAKEQQRIYEQNQLCEQKKQEEERASAEKKYQSYLVDLKTRIYPNSPVTREILGNISQNGQIPFSIEVKNTGLLFSYEGFSKTYVFRAHGLKDMDKNEEKIFAEVLNQKLNSRYSVREQTKYHPMTYSDGTIGGWTEHIATIMELQTTRSF